MIKRQTAGSVVCPTCGRLVGVQQERCLECGRWNPGLWGYAPILQKLGNDMGFTQIVIGGCVLLYLIGLLLSTKVGQIQMSGWGILGAETVVNRRLGASGFVPLVLEGRWWTPLSAAWLHGGLVHILFNMMWIRQMAPVVGQLFGVGRLVIIYTLSSIAGFTLTSLVFYAQLPGPFAGAPLTLGASAPLFGLFGALTFYGKRTGNRMIGQQMIQFLLIMVVFGLLVPGIDNWAHAGGFGGGYLVARWLDPMKPEKQEHLFVALLCLLAMAGSVALSVLVPLKY